MSTNNLSTFRQLMEEVKFGHTSTEEAAARIDAYVAAEVERALKDRGITPVPNAEQRLLRDIRNLSSSNHD